MALCLDFWLIIRDNYEVLSNRESGFGRYDVVLVPRRRDVTHLLWSLRCLMTVKKWTRRYGCGSAQTN